jgi:hypothetical protein
MILLAILLFPLPILIAAMRKHRNTAAIVVLSLLLGWTVVCWVIALVWACTDSVKAGAQQLKAIPGETRKEFAARKAKHESMQRLREMQPLIDAQAEAIARHLKHAQ